MRKHLLKLISLLVVFLCANTIASAGDSEYCYTLIENSNGNFLMNWNTEENGDVTIKMLPVAGVGNASDYHFRGNGWNDTRLQRMTLDGVENTGFQFFTREINAEKTIITLHPQVEIEEGSVISINQVLEYASPINNNAWPTIQFTYTYGSTCAELVVTELEKPEIIGIDDSNVVTFTSESVADAADFYNVLVVYRKDTNLLEYQVENIVSGDVIDFNINGDYDVVIYSKTKSLNYSDSEISEIYSWAKTNGDDRDTNVGFSEYCSAYFKPAGEGTDCYFTWTTNDEGQIVIAIEPFDGDTGTKFRDESLRDYGFQINGVSGTWFSKELIEGSTKLVLTPLVTIYPGDKIHYTSNYVCYETSKKGNLFPNMEFDYTYGADCAGAPELSASKSSISFNPNVGVQTFTISGSNLNIGESVVIKAPRGLSATPASVQVDENGSIDEVEITVNWTSGSNGGEISIEGAGLLSAVKVSCISTGFGDYCNKIVTMDNGNHPFYLSISQSPDKTKMILEANPFADGESVTWAGNSVSVENILVAGNMPEVTPTKTIEGNILTIEFAEPIANGDVVTFGSPLVWSITGGADPNGNCFVNQAKTYTAGLSCGLAGVPPTITSVSEASEITQNSAKVSVVVAQGDYPIESVVFTDGEKVVSVAYNNEGEYVLTGLDGNKAYSFTVTATDENGNESEPFAGNVEFTTLAQPNTVEATVKSVSFNKAVITIATEGSYAIKSVVFGTQSTMTYTADGDYTLIDLTPETEYNLDVYIIDENDVESEVSSISFTTEAMPDIEFATVSASLDEVAQTTASILIVTTDGDYAATSLRIVEKNGLVAEQTIAVTDNYVLTNLMDNTNYAFDIYVSDAEGFENSTPATVNFKTAYYVTTIDSIAIAKLTPDAVEFYIGYTQGSFELEKVLFGTEELVKNDAGNYVLDISEKGYTNGQEISEIISLVDGSNEDITESFAFTYEYIIESVAAVMQVAVTDNTATVSIITSEDGTAQVATITLVEKDGKVADVVLNKAADDVYVIEGLAANTTYVFTAIIKDENGYESEASSEFTFTTEEEKEDEPDGPSAIGDNSVVMMVYPNPAVDEITISGVEVQQVVIADMTGKVVLRVATENVVNVSSLEAGIYIIEVVDNAGNIMTEKLVVR